MSPFLRKSNARAWLDQLIHATGRSLDQYRDAFWRLITAIRASSTLLAQADGPSPCHRLDSDRLVAACSSIARTAAQWIRDPESWSPLEDGRWQLFRSLLDHVFAQYPVPAFMTWVWLEAQGAQANADLARAAVAKLQAATAP
jgi:hypothetical protein